MWVDVRHRVAYLFVSTMCSKSWGVNRAMNMTVGSSSRGMVGPTSKEKGLHRNTTLAMFPLPRLLSEFVPL